MFPTYFRLSRTPSLALSAALAMAVAPQALLAQSGPSHADLQSQINNLQSQLDDVRDTAAPTVFTDRSRVRLTFGGRISAGVLFAEQGGQDQTFLADNDASGSRFGVTALADLNENVTAGLRFEFSAEVNSTDDIDFGFLPGANDAAPDFGDVRHAEAFVFGESFGRIAIGQGNTAAEDSAHSDLSGTSLAGAGSDVDDIAGGLSFVVPSGTDLGSDGDVDAFFDIQDGFRTTRLFYETPEFQGFVVRASVSSSEDDEDGDGGVEPAIGVFYGQEFSNLEVEASASWRQEIANEDRDNFYVGSASILLASGLNFTLAGSYGDIDGEADETTAVFTKLGYRADIFNFGETRFSIDYFRGENNFDFASPTGILPEAESFGISAVQQISATNAEVFATYRRYEIDDVFIGGVEEDVDALNVFFTGARIRF